MRKNIGYHTRHPATGEKISGGSFGGQIDQETVERLVRAHFTVEVLVSGRPTFVDREGRRVRLYLSVDPETTEIGQEELRAYRQHQEELERADRQTEEGKQRRIDELLDVMSSEEVLRRLEGDCP